MELRYVSGNQTGWCILSDTTIMTLCLVVTASVLIFPLSHLQRLHYRTRTRKKPNRNSSFLYEAELKWLWLNRRYADSWSKLSCYEIFWQLQCWQQHSSTFDSSCLGVQICMWGVSGVFQHVVPCLGFFFVQFTNKYVPAHLVYQTCQTNCVQAMIQFVMDFLVAYVFSEKASF